MKTRIASADFRFAKGRGETPILLREGFIPPIVAADAGSSRTITYVFSDTSVGRDNHVIAANAWQLGNFNRNPVFLWAHDADSPPIGRVVDLGTINGQLRGAVEYAEREVYPFADTIFLMVKAGFINATSTGWLPLDWKRSTDPSRPGGVDFSKVDLLEISQVPVPALPTALASGRSVGIDVSPFVGWAERALDGGATATLPRKELEMVRRAAGAPAVFPGAAIESAEDRKRKAEGRAAALGGGKFESFGHFLRACAEASGMVGTVDPRLEPVTRTATGLGEVDPSNGGFLVPTEYLDGLVTSLYSEAVAAPLCDRRQTDKPGNAKLPAIDETSRANGQRSGGGLAFWLNEGVQPNTSFPRFRGVEFAAHKLIGLAVTSNELLADAPMLDAYMRATFAAEMSYQLDKAIIAGSGLGQPLGILTAPGTVTVPKEAGQASTTIVAENVRHMWARMPGPCRKRAVWLICEDAENQLDALGGGGRSASGLYLPQGAGGNATPLLKGRPVLTAEQCSVLGTPGDILLVDLNQYVLVDAGMKADLSVDVSFLHDETVFRFALRIDGKPLWAAPITPANGSAFPRSPFVALAAR